MTRVVPILRLLLLLACALGVFLGLLWQKVILINELCGLHGFSASAQSASRSSDILLLVMFATCIVSLVWNEHLRGRVKALEHAARTNS